MTATAPARVVHLLVDPRSTDVVCGVPAVNVTSNPDAANCPACASEEVEPAAAPVPQRPATGLRSPDGLRAFRARHRLSQRALASLLETDHRTVFRWEAGGAPISRIVELALRYLDRYLDYERPQRQRRAKVRDQESHP
jgi:DNA-binding transcriptional regulator YiaG